MKKLILTIVSLLFTISFTYANEIKPYEIVSEKDTSFVNRSRAQIFIVSPEAKSLQARIDTAKIAATDYSSQKGVKVVSVFLMPFAEAKGSGYYLAQAFYWSDGCGNSGTQCNDVIWEVKSTEQQLTDDQLEVAKEYYANKDVYFNSKKFLDKNGLPNEKKIISDITQKLKIKNKNIEIPLLFLEQVE